MMFASRERPPNGWSWQSTVSAVTSASPGQRFSRKSTEKPFSPGIERYAGSCRISKRGAMARTASPTGVCASRAASTARRSSLGSVTRIEFVTRACSENFSMYGHCAR